MKSTIISQNTKRLQIVKGLSIPQLAEISGVSVRTIERIRNGKHVPDNHTIILLAKALGQKPEHLVEGAALHSCKHKDPTVRINKAYEERKDFTKFERELSETQAAKEWNKKIDDCLDAIELAEIEYMKSKRQLKRSVIIALCAAAIAPFLVHLLFLLLPNPWL